MQAIVIPSKVSGTVTAPASKSAMQRACAAALIHKGETNLFNPGQSADDKAALSIIKQLGATVERENDKILISSDGIKPMADLINCGESGLSVRMFTSIAALSDKPISVTGTGSLLKRPLGFFNEVLPLLGVKCISNKGFLPLNIQGPLKPGNISIDGSLSSQFLTGLLFAYSAADANGVSIKVNNLNSRPYIDLTLQVMKAFNLKCPINNNYEDFYFEDHSEARNNSSINFTVEADWSGGAFLLVAAAIAGKATVKGLDTESTQADKAIINALQQTGVHLELERDKIEISKNKLAPFQFDATDCPDLFPPLVALAAYSDGRSSIKGVHRLTHKESNRALTLQEEFGKMGVAIKLHDDLMVVEGGEKIKSAIVSSHHDHRIAMACAIAALRAEDKIIINDAEAVNKSYPNFWEDLHQLTTAVSLKQN